MKAAGRPGLTWAAHLYCTAASSGPPWSEWVHRPHPQSQRGRHCDWSALCPGFWSRSSAPRQAGVGQHGSAQDQTLSPLQPSLPCPTPWPLCALTSSTLPSIPYESPGGKWTSTREPSSPSQKKVWCFRQGYRGRGKANIRVEAEPGLPDLPAPCVEEASPLWVGVGWFVQDP